MENAAVEMVELSRNAAGYTMVVEEIVRMEKKIFPKHESLSKSFDSELARKNTGLLYAHINGEIAGYVMYSWPSSLSASITKLAVIVNFTLCANIVKTPLFGANAIDEVKDKFRRRGYGEALLRAAIEKCRARNIHRISLHVDPARSPALSLYKKLGFLIDSLVEQYYSIDRDAYRMYLDFYTQQ